MVIAERKPIDDIRRMLEGYRKVLLLGCGECVTVCMAGGAKEVAILASALRMVEPDKEFVEATVERQCEREYIDEARPQMEGCDAVLSLACGAGGGVTPPERGGKPGRAAQDTNSRTEETPRAGG